MQIKSLKAKANARRSLTERMADVIVSKSGSFWFLSLNFVWFAIWIVGNTGWLGNVPFDPYPFTMLTTVVSLEAIILSILVLMSQNRQTKVGDLREEIDLQLDVITEKEITKVLELLVLIAKKHKVMVEKDEVLAEMLKVVDREKIERILAEQIEE